MNTKRLSEKLVKFFIYLIVVVLINCVGITLFFRIDLTKNGVYSLSEASKAAVKSLSDPLTIKVFFTENLPAPYNNIEQYLRDLLEEYRATGSRYFNYQFYNVTPADDTGADKTAENRKIAESFGIPSVQIRVVEKDEVKFKTGYMGLVIIHGDMVEKIPTITSTDRLEYQLTTAMRKLNNKISTLVSLDGKVEARLFISPSIRKVAPYMGLKDLAGLKDRVKSIIDEMNRKQFNTLTYQFSEPATDAEIKQVGETYDIMTLQWPDIPKATITAGKGIIGMVMEYKGKRADIPVLRVINIPLFGQRYELAQEPALKEAITQAMESLVDINESIGYLADHGSPSLFSPPAANPFQQAEPGLGTFNQLARQNYSLKEIQLADEDIPDGLNSLIICDPTEAFTEYELYQIDQFLMKGNDLAVFVQAFEEKMPPQQNSFNMGQQGPTYHPIDTGLAKLLDHYGIRVKKSYVMDENCFKQQKSQRMGGGEQAVYFAPMIKKKFINADLDFMQPIKGLVVLKASPLELDTARLETIGAETTTLFSTSDRSWEMREPINLNPMFIRPPSDEKKFSSQPLAVMIQGEFPSYFAGKKRPIRTKASDETELSEADKKKAEDLKALEQTQPFIEKGKPGTLFVVGSPSLLNDNLLDPEGKSPNATFVMNILDVMNGRDGIAAMRSKDTSFNPLDETSAGLKAGVKFFNIGGLPALTALFGILVWVRRIARRKRIQLMFDI